MTLSESVRAADAFVSPGLIFNICRKGGGLLPKKKTEFLVDSFSETSARDSGQLLDYYNASICFSEVRAAPCLQTEGDFSPALTAHCIAGLVPTARSGTPHMRPASAGNRVSYMRDDEWAQQE